MLHQAFLQTLILKHQKTVLVFFPALLCADAMIFSLIVPVKMKLYRLRIISSNSRRQGRTYQSQQECMHFKDFVVLQIIIFS